MAQTSALIGASCVLCAARAAQSDGIAMSLRAPLALARLHVSGEGALFGVTTAGELLQYTAERWQRVGVGLDPATPVASGDGRIAGRASEGGVWVLERGRVFSTRAPKLAPHAGLLVLPAGIIGMIGGVNGASWIARLEPDARGRWIETARSSEPVLPDARPVHFDLDGAASDENGHVAVLGAPDNTRYRHGVLGDDIEATSLLLLERHGLAPLMRLDLPSPYVFEDLAPRPIAWRGRRALLTVRSGPLGSQLAVVAAAGNGGPLVLAALGAPLGAPRRWLAPTTDGVRLCAVHTPHVGGVLNRYRESGDRLIDEVIASGVNNHKLGERELDVSAWFDRALLMPAQDRRSLRWLAIEPGAWITSPPDVPLPAPVVTLHRWSRMGKAGAVALLLDGSVYWIATA